MPGTANMFDAMLSSPEMQNAFAGAFSGGGAQDMMTKLGINQQALLHAAATGQQQTEQPRTGLGAVGAKLGLMSPTTQVNQPTMDLESLIVQKKLQMDLERKQNAIVNFAGIVDKVGGPAATALAPMFFGPMLTDPEIQHGFAAVVAHKSIQERELQEKIRHDQTIEVAQKDQRELAKKRVGIEQTRASTEQIRATAAANKPGKTLKTPADLFEETAARKLSDPNNLYSPEQIDTQASMEAALGVPPDKGIFQVLSRAAHANPPKAGESWAEWLSRMVRTAMSTGTGGPAEAPAAPAPKPAAAKKPVVPF